MCNRSSPLAKLKLKHKSIPVNPILAYPAYLAGYIERLGTGTKDLVEACVAKGLKALEFMEDEDFCTIIWRDASITDGKKDGKKELSDRQLIIYTLLKENPMLNIADLASKMIVSPRTISRELEALRNLNLIERKDGRKGGCWIVK